MGIHDREYARTGSSFGRGMGQKKPMTISTWLILFCVGIFVIDGFVNGLLSQWLYLSTDKAIWGVHYWRFIGFQFLHASPMHLIFNMIGIYFFGPLVEQYLGRKRFFSVLLALRCLRCCAVFGIEPWWVHSARCHEPRCQCSWLAL